MRKLVLIIWIMISGGSCPIIAQNFSVNAKGIGLYSITNSEGQSLVIDNSRIRLHKTSVHNVNLWRKTNLADGFFYLDAASDQNHKRLRATSYLGVNTTTTGVEGRNSDVKWTLVKTKGGMVNLLHRSSNRLLCSEGDSVYLTDDKKQRPAVQWRLELKKLDLASLESPRILMGDDKHGFRDPALIRHNGMYYMYYSFVKTEEQGRIYWYLGMSKSEDLVHWSDPKIITEKDQTKNFASPGNIIRWKDHWVICMQTYVMPGYTRDDPLRFGNKDCRIWIMRSFDLENWSEPEMLEVKGPGVDPGQMIDVYLQEDKDEKGKWWAFFKQRQKGESAANYSYSYDLKNWTYQGFVEAGENVCVWVEDDTYYMLHSPEKGMGLLTSKNLKKWKPFFEEEILGQEEWGDWCGQRVTAGFVLDLRDDPAVGKYLMFFHGQGPAPKTTEIINSGTDMAIAWSDDLVTWEWPGKKK